jgi:hypothetical protein
MPLELTPLELTPLRVDEIAAILKAGIDSIAFPIYRGGAAQRQSVRRLPVTYVSNFNAG